jgi:hypothetical protein
MLAEVSRPFSAAERRLLRRRATIPKVGSVFWMRDERRTLAWTIGICVALLAVGAFLQQLIVAAVMGAIIALVRLGGYLERRRLRQHQLAFRQRLTEELESENAYTVTCRPTRIIEREEFEDEGTLWIFDGGEGRYLVLCGQDYYSTARFPSSQFEVVMGSLHRTVIGIRSHGPRIQSSKIVSGEQIGWDVFPERDVTLFDAPADAELSTILCALRTSNAVNSAAAKPENPDY